MLGGEGNLHLMYISNGQESQPPVKFLPPNSGAQGLTVIDDVAYAATPGCNGAGSGIWALDITSKQVQQWRPSTGAVVGSAGPAFGPEGDIYASTTGGELTVLGSKTLAVKGTFTTGVTAFSSSPTVFAYKEKTLVAAASKDGRILLFDAAAPGSPVFATPAYSADFAPSALSTFQSADGTRWLLAAGAGAPSAGSGFQTSNGTITSGAVVAWKLAEQNGRLQLQPAWVSRDMTSPLAPMVINGVVFAVSSGEYRPADSNMTAAERIQKSSPAVIYALDLNTGKSTWDSGTTITSFVHSGGLSGGAGQIYLETFDQTVYAFGYAIEH
jgi:hypothetical protein